MDFAWAINALKAGLKVTRKGWNGKGMFLWLIPATDVKAEWCKEPVLKGLAEANGGTIPCLGAIRMYTHDSTGRKAVLTGWLASQSDMLSDDWQIYFGEGHEKQTPEEIEAYKKLMLDRMPGGPFGQQMLELGTLKAQQEKASLDKLPKAGSMENCEILSNAINQLLDKINKMPQLHAEVQPGPNDKELTVTIVEEEPDERIAMTLNVTEICREAIGCTISNTDGITKSSLGCYSLNDKVEN